MARPAGRRGRRERRAGHAATAVPATITPEPIQSQTTSGFTRSPTTTSSLPSAGVATRVRYRSSRIPVRTDGVPMAWALPRKVDSAGS